MGAGTIPFCVPPMPATLVAKPLDRAGWVYEEKYDGYRVLAYKTGSQVTLASRNDKDGTEAFARVAHAVTELKPRAVLLDG